MKASSFAAGAWLAIAFVCLLYFVAGDKSTVMEFFSALLIPGVLLVLAATLDPND